MSGSITFTACGLDEIKAERESLYKKRGEAVENLRIAREMGDLSENAAYKVARQKLSSIDFRIRHLTYLIRSAKVSNKPDTGTIGIGSEILLHDGKKELNIKMVGSFESNPAEGKISHLSPIGKALIGKRVNDKITIQVPSGSVSYRVKSVK